MTVMGTDVTAAFLDWAEHDRMRSLHTLIRYRSSLATLAPFGDLLTLTRDDLDMWWTSRILLNNGFPRSAASRSNELACLRTFYKWATKKNYRPDDPTAGLDFLTPENHVPRAIGKADLERLLGPLTMDALDLRRAIALGAYAGMRVSEVAALDWRDIDTEAHRLFVRGKGQWERPIGLSMVLLDALVPITGGNVVKAGGVPYAGATLQRKVNRLIRRAGIDHSFHDLRKRGASLALSRGMNPAAVRVAFGWRSMETVTHYAVVGDEELDRIAEAMI
jgi:integrase/recombinase XerD